MSTDKEEWIRVTANDPGVGEVTFGGQVAGIQEAASAPVGIVEAAADPVFSAHELSADAVEEVAPEALLMLLQNLKTQDELLALIASEVFARADEKPAVSEDALIEAFRSIKTPSEALRYGRMIEQTLGRGTLRKIVLIGKYPDAVRDLIKTFVRDLRSQAYERQIEEGYFTNIKKNYGISWDVVKAGRDAFQNFYDANNHTLDGVRSSLEQSNDAISVTISADQTYHWTELIPIGASTKQESDQYVGGFGEGAKMLALVLLRDYGAQTVKYASGDWEIEFYFDKIPKGASIKGGEDGLWVKKRTVNPPQKGNTFTATFSPDEQGKSLKLAQSLMATKELFYSSENPDYQDAHFNNDVGGFKILIPTEEEIRKGRAHNRFWRPEGHFYAVGQRTHYEYRDRWDTVDYLHIWTWKKTLPKDRDRGVVSSHDFSEHVLKPIVASMTLEEAEKAVYDFMPLWDSFAPFSHGGYDLLQLMCEKLGQAGRKLTFDRAYVANDVMSIRDPLWQEKTELLHQNGCRLCPKFMSLVGMEEASVRYAELTTTSSPNIQ